MRVAIIGAGIGGLTAAAALRRVGLAAHVYEQADQFGRVGAAINIMPNAMRVFERLGLAERIFRTGYVPPYRLDRQWNTGEITSRAEMGDTAVRTYGSPQVTLHRADLLAALEAAVPPEQVHLGHRLVAVTDEDDGPVHLRFANGHTATADAVIGADGIHSVVRAKLFGEQPPRSTGAVAYRSIVPARHLPGLDLTPFTKWWGPSRAHELVTFLINSGRDLFVFGSVPDDEVRRESWLAGGDVRAFQAAFAAYHDDARAVVGACEETFLTALNDRDPLPQWTIGRITLLGDACHPMTPYIAQGAAMAVEDAAVLSRCICEGTESHLARALAAYAKVRMPRTSRVQRASHANDRSFLKTAADWLYGYDAWTVPLASGAVPGEGN